MEVLDKQVCKAQIESMVETLGWKLIEVWLKEQINGATKRLQTADPEDKAKIYTYQGTIKNYTSLLAYIDTLKK